MRKVFELSAHTSFNLQVLELCLPPMTIIASQILESSDASDCLSAVALHIVSNILQFVHTFSIIFSHFFHSFLLKVVCDTQIELFLSIIGFVFKIFLSSSSFLKTKDTPLQ